MDFQVSNKGQSSTNMYKRHYVCVLMKLSIISVRILFPFLFLPLFLLNLSNAWSQDRLSRREAKQQENQTKSTRYFIEGEKALVLGELDKALFYFGKSDEFMPDQPAVSYKIAETLVRSNQAQKALSYAEKAALADTENKYYALMVAEIYSNLKQPLKAAEILDQLTSDSEKNQQYNLDLASIYLQAGEFDKALVVLDRAEEYYGIRDQFTVQKQRIYLRKNNLQAAIEEGQKLVDAFPGNPNYVLNLVEILYNNAKIDQAITLVEGEIAKYPNQPELQMAAYTLFKEKGQAEKSNQFLLSGMGSADLDPEVKARTFLSILNEMQTSDRIALLDQLEVLMIQSSSDHPAILEALGARKEKQNNLTEALPLYKKSLQLNPKNAPLIEKVVLNSFGENANLAELETYTQMGVDEFPQAAEFWFYDGIVKSSLKKDSLAVNSLTKSLQLNASKNPQLDQVAFGALGSSYFNLSKKDSSFHYFEKALTLNPEDEQVLNNYAYFLSLEKRDLEKARKMAQKVATKHPNNATYLDTLAWVLFQMGDHQEASRYMAEAIAQEDSPSGTLMEHYGDILYHLGKTQEAITWWKKAQKTDEKSDKLDQKITDGKYHE